MGEERSAVVFTDPPYNVPIDGHASRLGAIHHRSFPMASGEMDGAEFTAFFARRVCQFGSKVRDASGREPVLMIIGSRCVQYSGQGGTASATDEPDTNEVDTG